MAMDSDGRLMSAYQDTCENYTPDKEKPTRVKSVKLGTIYKCKKYDQGVNADQGCYWCVNKKNL